MAVLCVARALALAVGLWLVNWLVNGPVAEDRGIGRRRIKGRRGGHLGECRHYDTRRRVLMRVDFPQSAMAHAEVIKGVRVKAWNGVDALMRQWQ